MNILLSHNWLKEYVKTKLKPEDLAKALTLHSMSVERILPEVSLLSDKIVLGEILEVNNHPNADKLKLAIVSTGDQEHKVVCGAPNILPGMKIAFAKPGAIIKWHGEGDPVELQESVIRGELSKGMICDDSEIGLAKLSNPEGVTDYGYLEKCKPGTPMAKALGLNDFVYDIEITVNRIDAGNVVGMARELSAITGEEFAWRQPAGVDTLQPETEEKELKVTVKDTEKCWGFNAVVLDDVKVGPSPDWLKRRLRASGHSTFNNVVDVTNYVMRELGQPMHTYDYNKIKDGHLIVRQAKKGETATTLDGVEEKLEPYMAVVADEEQNHGLGGVMGGASSMISEETKTVLLEVASWNPFNIRKTMMNLDKFSDAGSYFTKHVSPQMAQIALMRAVELLKDVAGAKVASKVVSEAVREYIPKKVEMRMSRAQMYVGAKLDENKVKKQLQSLGFMDIGIKEGVVSCLVPHWRQFDIEIEEDLIEEVCRLFGYHNVENKLPSGRIPFPKFDKDLIYEQRLKSLMKAVGYTECYTYSLVSEDLLEISKKDTKKAIALLNPLDDEHVYMRTRLLPSLLEVAANNQGNVDRMRLFEITNIYTPQGKHELPDEHSQMAFLLMDNNAQSAFRKIKGVVEAIGAELGLKLTFTEKDEYDLTKNGGSLSVVFDNKEYGTIGLVNGDLIKKFGLKRDVVVCELAIRDLIAFAQDSLKYEEPAKFPSIEIDLSIDLSPEISWQTVNELIGRSGGEYLKEVSLFDIYQKDNRKSFAFHLQFRSDEKTLEMNDIKKFREKIVSALQNDLKAELRG